MTDFADAVDDLEPGQVRFFQHAIPTLDAGDYELTVSQQLRRVGVTSSEGLFTRSQSFRVEAPRLGLGPSDVHSVYPPANSAGHFDGTIPHIVLRRRSLPWEIDLRIGSDRVPWLALLVFHGAEAPEVRTGTVRDLLDGPAPQGRTLPRGVAAAVDGQQHVSVIDVDNFQDVRPQNDDRKWMAHVRQVRTDNKELLGLNEDGWFSTIVSHRLPAVGRNVVHLVSLEGVGFNRKKVRLISMASWSFTAEAARGNFAEKIAAVSVDTLRAATRHDAPADPSDAANKVTTAVDAGFVPLRYDMRHGEQSVGWYRGPLVPLAPRPVERGPLPTAEAGLIYHPALGMFDVSIAVAWQLGRLLALSDASFSTALMAWRQQAQSYVDAALARTDAAERHAQLEGFRSLAELIEDADDDTDVLEHSLRQFILDLWDGDSTATNVSNFARRFVFGEIEGQLPPPRRDDDRLRPVGDRAQVREPAPVDHSQTPSRQASPDGDAPDPSERVNDLEQHVEDVGLLELAMPELPQEISAWLGRLALLYGVPFEHLVPDRSMVPVESIRFFHLDSNWMHALVDGAFSVGVHSDRDVRFHSQLQHKVRAATAQAAGSLRSDVLGLTSTGQPSGGVAVNVSSRTGFLLRSEIVSGWPGLEVTASVGSASDKRPVKVLRLDRPAPDLLFCVFDERPDSVVLAEPPEDLHFGIDRVEQDDPKRSFRRSNARPDLIDFNRLTSWLANQSKMNSFGPADLAEKMIETASAQQFGTNT